MSPELVCERKNAPFDLGAEWIRAKSPDGNHLFVSGERVALSAANPYQALCVWAVPQDGEVPEEVPRVTIRIDLVEGGMAHLLRVHTSESGYCRLALSCSSGQASPLADKVRVITFDLRMTKKSRVARIIEVPPMVSSVSCGGAIVGLEWIPDGRISTHVRDFALGSIQRNLTVKIISSDPTNGWMIATELPGGNAYSKRVQLLYFGFVGGLVEIFCGIRLVITGSEELRDGYLERPLVIANVNDGLDALSMVCLCLRLRRLSTLKFIVDDSWRRVPIIGWAMQMMLFPFVRSKNADEKSQKEDRNSLRQHIE
ncbi:hypothetical protein FOL47_006055 [Perkinsus chesapeaki]|uniref:Uncharacterized protein n=1 Tax=Perkinsus chesapeaki TaxID=330153 RepID=A0A7J6LUF9_PERCH|nr:hypothetical protein FOL47_006055 [Perkinsus chesapeaki]